MAARVTDGNASATESTWSTDTAYQNKCTFSKTPAANSTALVFYSALIANSSTTYLTSARLRNSTSAVTLCEAVFNPRDATDYVCVSGFAIETFGASPASQTYNLDFATSNTAGTAAIKNAEIWYLELDASDFTAINDGPHTVTDTNFVTGVTMTQTFANGVDYYILAMAEPSTTSTSPIPTIEAFYDGATSYGTMAHDFGNTSEFGSWSTQFKITGAGTSKDIIIRCKSSSTIDVAFRKARLVALRADKFEASFYNEDRTRTTNSTTTYTDKVTSTQTLAAVEHIVIGGGILDCPSVTQSALMQLIEDAASLGEHIHEANTASETGGASCYHRGYRKTFAAGSVTWKTQWKAETSTAMGLKESSILVLQTGAASGTTYNNSFTETVTVTDSSTASTTGRPNISETSTATESAIASRSASVTIAETGTPSDSYTATPVFINDLTETATASDTVAARASAPVAASESISASDTSTANTTGNATLTESATPADSYTGDSGLVSAFTETTTAADIRDVAATCSGATSESTTCTDTLDILVTGNISLSETVAANDNYEVTVIPAPDTTEEPEQTGSGDDPWKRYLLWLRKKKKKQLKQAAARQGLSQFAAEQLVDQALAEVRRQEIEIKTIYQHMVGPLVEPATAAARHTVQKLLMDAYENAWREITQERKRLREQAEDDDEFFMMM